jgi:hypothetical protein
MKILKRFGVIVCALALTGMVAPAIAGPADDSKTEDKDNRQHDFSGKLQAVDTAAKTLTIDGKSYVVTDSTKITRQGKTATLAELAVGDEVKGESREVEGKNELVSVKATPKKIKES